MEMNGRGESDNPVVARKLPHKGEPSPTEAMERRGLAEETPPQQNVLRTQDRESTSSALERIRAVAQRDKTMRFTSLYHLIYRPDMLETAFLQLKRNAAPGVDGQTWQSYKLNLQANLQDLSERLKRMGYRPQPVRRVYIPKPDGRQRPLGVTALEDKIVQKAAVMVMEAIYETDFADHSYGCRPGRSQHDALDALYVHLYQRNVNWVLDMDIRAFFDTIDHEWLMKICEHRIADGRLLRLLRRWLKAGVLEDGNVRCEEAGTPQGGVISPLLANIFLHYVLDLWTLAWRHDRATGELYAVRYVDDAVVLFEQRGDAERFRDELRERLKSFGLELHPDKTRLLEFGRHAADDRRRRGEGKPDTFDFLGFTHICGKTLHGKFTIFRHTIRKRSTAKLKAIAQELRRRLHDPVPDVGKWLGSVLRGHYNYYGVPMNSQALGRFYVQLVWLWRQSLRRRSQRHHITWERMKRLAKRWLPPARITHPYPTLRRARQH